jgi:hypothetical protein
MEGCIKVKAFSSFQVDPIASSRRFRFLFFLSITGAEHCSRNLNRSRGTFPALKFQFISGTSLLHDDINMLSLSFDPLR